MLSFAVTMLLGCGDGKIRRYPVSGSVQVGGKPAAGARVIFCPVGGSEAFQKERPSGVTGPDGSFILTTFLKDDGAPAGDYQVMVVGGGSRGKRGNDDDATSPPRIDRKYAKPAESGLTATVPAEATTLPPFQLEPATRQRR
ncbi:hypothetical protein Pla111_06910 [Botrimarina hoheduenensis]|uniref:Carboxypeptidase regulatory-like domain-containing protein n=2 Tax=Botrimarina hoheduenensis TaxID=2528000 RepID=A0A5C5WDX0_9BACT|nr:hypothetical protein Pla111_06910 [Botrimarina hoheduenensis]